MLPLLYLGWVGSKWVWKHRERARWWRSAVGLYDLTDPVTRRVLGWKRALEARNGR